MMKRRQRGVTYLGVLLLLAIGSIVVAGQAAFSSIDGGREREAQLLAVGAEFRRAIASYFESTPGPDKQYPRDLEDLVLDRRFHPPRRHLRRIYSDPVTGTATWGRLRAPGGGIMGIHSLSEARPFRQAGLTGLDGEFVGKEKYSDWAFKYSGPETRHIPPRMRAPEAADATRTTRPFAGTGGNTGQSSASPVTHSPATRPAPPPPA
jgi:type II secretory pathway pseudopilin PulG